MIASGLTRTPERLASKDFILLSPYIVNGAAITRRADEPEITGWATVCGKTMGAVRGGSFQKIATEKLPQGCVTASREYPGSTELFLDLANGRIDFAAHDFLGPNYLLKSGKAQGLVVLDELLATITQSVAVNAKEPELAKAIDATFVGWRDDGTLQKLAEKWFGASIDWSKVENEVCVDAQSRGATGLRIRSRWHRWSRPCAGAACACLPPGRRTRRSRGASASVRFLVRLACGFVTPVRPPRQAQAALIASGCVQESDTATGNSRMIELALAWLPRLGVAAALTIGLAAAISAITGPVGAALALALYGRDAPKTLAAIEGFSALFRAIPELVVLFFFYFGAS